MRVLVTGGAGFIGSHVVDAYVREGHEVVVVDDLSRGRLERISRHARFVQMDICSPVLKDLVTEGGFDCVNHHAAQIDVRSSVADPSHDAMINIVGTLNLLEAARDQGIPRIIFASTGGAIYGDQRHFPSTEQHPTVPLSPYGVAKLAVEHYLEYYRQAHGLQSVVLRYANVYGPRQDPEGEAGLVAIFCGKILRGQRLTIYGDGEQTRDYVHVQDVARANVLALRYLTGASLLDNSSALSSLPTPSFQLPARSQAAASSLSEGCLLPTGSPPPAGCQAPACPSVSVFNIGTGIETSVNAVAAMMLEAADGDCAVVYQPQRLGEQMRSVIDPSRAARVLGWIPMTPLAEGLMETLSWFRSKELAAAGGYQQAACEEVAGSRQWAAGSTKNHDQEFQGTVGVSEGM